MTAISSLFIYLFSCSKTFLQMQLYVETQINESTSTGGAQGGRLLGTFHSVPEVTSEQPWVFSKALQDQHWKALS